MDQVFPYNRPVTGRQHIGRQTETKIFTNLLAQGENVVLYEPPKSGKHSLVQQGFLNMKYGGQRFEPVQLSLLDIRSLDELTIRLAGAALQTAGTGPEDYARAAQEHLAGSHLVFDPARFRSCAEMVSASWELDKEDLRAAFLLPYRIGAQTGVRRIVVLEEFSNVMLTGEGETVCRVLEEVFKTLLPELAAGACYVFLGSQVNAMHEIFGVRRWFWRRVERLRLAPLEAKDIADYITRGFLTSGKVIEREQMLGVCQLFRNNIWYISHFSAICDSLTRGYILEQTLQEALASLLAVHEGRFVATMNDLTTFQVGLLRAILDGHTRFSSAEVIKRYGLNSSANVRRLKDALCKKEIVTFDGEENPVILDPLFEYWVRKFYFKMPV